MSINKPRIVSIPKAAQLHDPDSATFFGRVREVINVIRAGQHSAGNVKPKKGEES
jgi:hypothetical protein